MNIFLLHITSYLVPNPSPCCKQLQNQNKNQANHFTVEKCTKLCGGKKAVFLLTYILLNAFWIFFIIQKAHIDQMDCIFI